jgi:Zn-dependent protease/predicted transcriptional regulator
MRWSIKIGRIAGIDVFIHTTFFLLIGWIGFSYWIDTRNLTAVTTGVGFLTAIFMCVVLHEFGHALAARRFGVSTKDITLLPIGGVARLEKIPEDPKQELWVAVAGPLVNVGIVILLAFWLLLTSTFEPITSISLTRGNFSERLLVANLVLVGFNMLPAFPMDGGRVLRSFLAMRTDYTSATQTAATIGQAMAFVFGFIGLISNPFLIFVAFFVYIGAQNEAQQVLMKSFLRGVPVREAMVRQFQFLSRFDRLFRAVDILLGEIQKDIPVVDDGRIVGILTHSSIIEGVKTSGDQVQVSEVMSTEFQTADYNEMLDSVLGRLQECNCQTMPVLYNDQLVGLITLENVGQYIRLKAVN